MKVILLWIVFSFVLAAFVGTFGIIFTFALAVWTNPFAVFESDDQDDDKKKGRIP